MPLAEVQTLEIEALIERRNGLESRLGGGYRDHQVRQELGELEQRLAEARRRARMARKRQEG